MAGRPSKIDAQVIRPNGTVTTVAERIVELLASGMYLERAAAEVQVHKATVYGWLAAATQARVGHALGRRTTRHEQRCLAFSDAVDQAEARHEATSLALLERLARGGIEQKQVTEKYERQMVSRDDGTVGYDLVLVERTERTQQTLPSVAAITWKLTRRYAERWGDRITVDTGDADAAAARGAADELRAYLAGAADGHQAGRQNAIEATATELP